MDQSEGVGRLIEPAVGALGYELVRVQMNGGRQATLQIMVERQDRRPMLVEDCVKVSREISALLDAANPIAEDYELEVSSPGIDRPLVKKADYERFAGHEVRVEIEAPIDGRKRFHGTIAAMDGETVRIDTEEGAVSLPIAAIRKAKLVLTDRLIAAARVEVGTIDDAEASDAAA